MWAPFNRPQFRRAGPFATNLLLSPQAFTGLIPIVDPRPTCSRLTVTWKLMAEAGPWCGVILSLSTTISQPIETPLHQDQIGQ